MPVNPLACTSAGVCGSGSCDPVPDAGSCVIDVLGVPTCFSDGDVNPNNPCEVCDSANTQTGWTPASAGTVCIAETCEADGRFQPESVCDAVGACQAVTPVNCGLYDCGAGGCGTTCDETSDCIDTAVCNIPSMTCEATTNIAPIADAGDDQFVDAEEVVTLDGTGSADPNGNALTFAWTFDSSSTGTAPALTNADQAQATFTVPREAIGSTYTFQLTVTDDGQPVENGSDTVTITIDTLANDAPVADISGPDVADAGQAIVLDGSGSSDPNGDAITYEWAFINEGQLAPTLDAATDEETFDVTFPSALDDETVYAFELTVTDVFGKISNPVARIEVTVSPEPVEGDMGADAGVDAGTDAGTDGGVIDADAGSDAGTNIIEPIGDLRGSSCLCAEVGAQSPSQDSPLALLALALLGLGFVRRRD